ncbi:MAG: transcriptional repressor LexA [bacterium]
MEPLTQRQAAVLEFIRTQIAREGRPPTLDEIGARFGIASSFGVRRHLTALEKKGYIERDAHAARGLRLTPEFRAVTGLPIVGRVAAGTPITAIENLEGYLSIESLFPSQEGLYCLEVQGDSMEEAGIFDGDYVVVQQKPVFDDGEIGVGIIDEECTVKRLRRVGDKIELRPASSKYRPWLVDPSDHDFRYGGKVVKVLSARDPVVAGA